MQINLENKKLFNSKILLFGEYTILLGEPALAIPFEKFNGYLSFIGKEASTTKEESNKVIRDFFIFLKKSEISTHFNLEKLQKDIGNRLYFHSNIPLGYGLGSSGALCAAIAREYGKLEPESYTYPQLKVFFSTMESFFHGKSSGIDPLVAYSDTPLYFEKNRIKEVNIHWEKLKAHELSVFLIDTLTVGETEPLVKWFSNQIKNNSFSNELQKKYIPSITKVIDSFLEADINVFKYELERISQFQLQFLHRMIPEHIQPVWKQGVTNKDYFLKLCGSGGGGFVLGFSFLNKTELSTVFRNMNTELTYII